MALSLLQLVLVTVVISGVPVKCKSLHTIMPFGDSITEWMCDMRNYYNENYTAVDPENVPSGTATIARACAAVLTKLAGTAVFTSALGGYRGLLGEKLAKANIPFAYVGNQWSCGSHSGYSGQTIEFLSGIAKETMANNDPDIVLYQAGTNDFFFPPPRGCNASVAVTRVHTLLDTVFETAPNVKFLVSTVPHINATRCANYPSAPWHPYPCPITMNPNIIAYNKELPGIVASYKAKGHSIFLHDINEAQFQASDYWIWGIHFNITGFDKLADGWLTAIQAVIE